ncbi:patched domain-containing protein 3 isoform X1 [Coccinella septempunctata]|uniref:patched domain-containing protein 3 isoform X1 n=2 Tax=Coccinella septempunctata TaxID=41139 RepID=UPI001D06AA18|nr:patched domain-containing protein 3 isoform X1 [Coccinella septempunctata]
MVLHFPRQGGSRRSDSWMGGLRCVDSLLNRAFYKLGTIVGKHPGYFIIVPVLLTLLGITGVQQMRNNIDPEYLFSPINGPGKYERAVAEEYFKVNYTSRFNVARITRAGRFGRVIVTSKDGIKNMLRAEIWKELRLLDGLIQNMTVFYNDEYFTYKDICARWQSECFQNDILNLDYIIDDVQTGALNLTFPLMFNPVTWDAHAFPVFFGGTEVSEDGIIISVPSVQLVYFGNADTKKFDKMGAAWEDAFLDLIEEKQDKQNIFEHIRIARFSSRTLDHELEKNTKSVVPYFSSTFAIMALFSVVTCMMTDWVRSKPWLGLLGNLSAAMATLCAFGICMYAGVDFIGINLAAPFLMIGIGIDDTFVMLAAWRRTSMKHSVPERMAQMMSEAAVSITITSVTDFFSFGIGIFSPFPSVTIFCIYSGAATCLLFIWHITFFAACVAISGYAEEKNLHSIICIPVQPVSKSQNRWWIYHLCCSGGVDHEDMDNPLDNTENGVMVFFRDYFAAFLNNGFVKFLVILVFLGYLAGAGYGVTQIQEGLERRKVAKNDSYAIEFFDREDDYYREFPYRMQVIVAGTYDYSNETIQDQVETLTQQLENTSYVSNQLYTESWLRSFLQYAERNQEYLNFTIDKKDDFNKVLKELWLPPTSPFSLDVKFDESGDNIVAMRFLVQAVNISGTEHEKEMVRALREICKESPLNATIFHPYFVFFDQFELVRPQSIQNMLIGGIIMMIVSFVFIPNFLCSFWVAISIVSIETGVIGYMALWGVNLDSISMINLIMCIGFSVDFTAHICYAYMSSKAESPDERVRECLYALGLPILQGSISTILGMMALILANNYIFAVFFKMVFLVVFFGAMHGLFLLPVLLSLFGPGSFSKRTRHEDIKMSNVEKSLPRPYCIPHPQLKINGGNLGNTLRSQNIPTLEKYDSANLKSYNVDKDLGLGTSEENSSESSSNHSNKKPVLDKESLDKKYQESWINTPEMSSSQFHTSQVLDIFGTDSEQEYYRRREVADRNRRQFQELPRREETNRRQGNGHRRYSPPESWYYPHPPQPQEISAIRRERALGRSNSYHNIMHPRYLQEFKFP